MEVYPEKKMDDTLHILRYAHDAVYHPFAGGGGGYTSVHRKIKVILLITLLLLLSMGSMMNIIQL